jgi:hypothetical protein
MPTDRLDQNRKNAALDRIAHDKRVAERSQIGIQGKTEGQYLASGGTATGQVVIPQRSGDVRQIDARHRTELPDEPQPIFTTYPFKTLLLVDNNKVFLGGDRTPGQITEPRSAFAFYGQLVNTGKISGWGASIYDSTTSPSRIRFYSPTLNTPKDLTVRAASTPKPIGGGYWLDQYVASPSITSTRSTISGPPFSTEVTSSAVSASGRSDSGVFNFSVRYDESANLSGSSQWAPYDAGALAIGAKTWTQTTLFNGVAKEGEFIYKWQNLDHTERIEGDRAYPVRVFSYDASATNPVEGFLGQANFSDNTTVRTTQNRAVDFSTINIAKTVDSLTSSSTVVPIIFVGAQARQYSATSRTRVLSSQTDNRSAGAGGTSGNYSFSETKTIEGIMTTPLTRPLKGDRVCLVIEDSFGTTQTVQTDETKGATSSTITETFRPSMQGPIFGYGGYIVSAAIIASGPLGGWHAGGNPGPATPGEPALTGVTIYRKGTLWDASQASGWGALGSNDGGVSWFSGDSFFGNKFDSAYNDNSTTSTVYTEVTYTRTLSATDIYDGPVIDDRHQWASSRTTIITDTKNYPVPRSYFLMTESETLTIDPEPFLLVADIAPSVINATASTLTLSTGSTIGITTQTSRLLQVRSVVTERLDYSSGVETPAVDTIHTATTHTSTPISLVGQTADVYRLTSGVITRWSGTVTALSGIGNPAPPAASGTTEPGRTFTNAFIGPYPQTLSVRNVTIAVDATEVVPFSPFVVSEGYYTLIINPDFAIMGDRYQSIRQVRGEGIASYQWANIQLGKGAIVASIFVAGSYQAGKKNYAAVWDFVKQPSGKCKITKRDRLIRGSTKADTPVTGGVLQAVQWFGSTTPI